MHTHVVADLFKFTRAKLFFSLFYVCLFYVKHSLLLLYKETEKEIPTNSININRESNLPHSSLYHPLIRELKWEKMV